MSTKQLNNLLSRGPALALLLAALSFFAYWPILNNGFISDDYVILQRTVTLKHQPFYLFTQPPEGFRTTSYLVFGLLKQIFGYHFVPFYIFAILLHGLNAFLLFKLLSLVTGRLPAAALASILFAAFQNPNEATMWLTGMHESLLGVSLLSALILWREEKYAWSALLYLIALFSKESAIILLALVPLVDYWKEQRFRFKRQYLYLAFPTIVFAFIFLFTLSENIFVSHGIYRFGFQSATVLVLSLHRLSFPWLYLAASIYFFVGKKRLDFDVVMGLFWMVVALLPYLFLTYQNHVPSRHEHLASMGMVASLAFLMEALRGRPIRKVLILVFITWNVGYLWFVKDAQYEKRAAPTNLLLDYLRSHPPGPIVIEGYPENPWIAKETTRLVPGWQPEMIKALPTDGPCPDCRKLCWNTHSLKYD